MHAAVTAGEMIGPAISSVLMRQSVWWPLILAVIIMITSLFTVPFLPETLKRKSKDDSRGSLTDDASCEDNQHDEFPGKQHKSFLSNQYHGIKEAATWLIQDRNLCLIILSFAFSGLGNHVMMLLLQYVSRRYGWKLADAALLATLRAAVNLVLYLTAMPAFLLFLTNRRGHTIAKANLQASRISVGLMSFGFLIMAIAPNVILMIFGLIIYVMGTGFPSTMRSVAITIIGGDSNHQTARLFATIGVVVALGSILSGPLIPLAWKWGLELGRENATMLGLPYLCASILMAGVTICVLFVRIPNGECTEEE
jgi:hypothetical protein